MIYWVIQTDIFGEKETNLIIDAVKKVSPFVLVDRSFQYDDLPSEDFIFRGSLEGYKRIKDWEHSYLINFFNSYNYLCSSYYPHVNNLLNSDYIILPKGDLKRVKELIFKCFDTDRLFIRPNSGEKPFPGTTLTKKWFENELDIIFGDYPVDDTELILISSFKELGDECRVVVGPEGVIAYDTYISQDDGPCLPSEGQLKRILSELTYSPDSHFTADLDLKSGKIIELNSFCCAGLYECDYNKVVSSVNKYFHC